MYYLVCDVIHYYDSVRVPVKSGRDAFEAILAGGVPLEKNKDADA